MSVCFATNGVNRIDLAITRAMALNLADWQDVSVRAFHIETTYTESLWHRQPGGPFIYDGAVIISHETGDDALFTELNRLRNTWGAEAFTLYDCWASRNLAPAGFACIVKNPWYLRSPASIPTGWAEDPHIPHDIIIERVETVAQLVDFELAVRIGGGDEEVTPSPEWQPFTMHAAATLTHPGMHYLVIRQAGQVVAGVIVHVTADMVAIYGIFTHPRFRRRGYGTALVRAAVALRPDLPATVFPDPPSVPMYTRSGFVRAQEIAVWKTALK